MKQSFSSNPSNELASEPHLVTTPLSAFFSLEDAKNYLNHIFIPMNFSNEKIHLYNVINKNLQSPTYLLHHYKITEALLNEYRQYLNEVNTAKINIPRMLNLFLEHEDYYNLAKAYYHLAKKDHCLQAAGIFFYTPLKAFEKAIFYAEKLKQKQPDFDDEGLEATIRFDAGYYQFLALKNYPESKNLQPEPSCRFMLSKTKLELIPLPKSIEELFQKALISIEKNLSLPSGSIKKEKYYIFMATIKGTFGDIESIKEAIKLLKEIAPASQGYSETSQHCSNAIKKIVFYSTLLAKYYEKQITLLQHSQATKTIASPELNTYQKALSTHYKDIIYYSDIIHYSDSILDSKKEALFTQNLTKTVNDHLTDLAKQLNQSPFPYELFYQIYHEFLLPLRQAFPTNSQITDYLALFLNALIKARITHNNEQALKDIKYFITENAVSDPPQAQVIADLIKEHYHLLESSLAEVIDSLLDKNNPQSFVGALNLLKYVIQATPQTQAEKLKTYIEQYVHCLLKNPSGHLEKIHSSHATLKYEINIGNFTHIVPFAVVNKLLLIHPRQDNTHATFLSMLSIAKAKYFPNQYAHDKGDYNHPVLAAYEALNHHILCSKENCYLTSKDIRQEILIKGLLSFYEEMQHSTSHKGTPLEFSKLIYLLIPILIDAGRAEEGLAWLEKIPPLDSKNIDVIEAILKPNLRLSKLFIEKGIPLDKVYSLVQACLKEEFVSSIYHSKGIEVIFGNWELLALKAACLEEHDPHHQFSVLEQADIYLKLLADKNIQDLKSLQKTGLVAQTGENIQFNILNQMRELIQSFKSRFKPHTTFIAVLENSVSELHNHWIPAPKSLAALTLSKIAPNHDEEMQHYIENNLYERIQIANINYYKNSCSKGIFNTINSKQETINTDLEPSAILEKINNSGAFGTISWLNKLQIIVTESFKALQQKYIRNKQPLTKKEIQFFDELKPALGSLVTEEFLALFPEDSRHSYQSLRKETKDFQMARILPATTTSLYQLMALQICQYKDFEKPLIEEEKERWQQKYLASEKENQYLKALLKEAEAKKAAKPLKRTHDIKDTEGPQFKRTAIGNGIGMHKS